VAQTKKTMKLALAFVAVVALGFAQDTKPPDKPKGPVAKDEAEAKLINTAIAEGDPAKRLAELDEWSQKYAQTEFQDQRQLLYLVTYAQLKKGREAFDKAKEILAKHPDDYPSLSTIVSFGPTLNNNNPSQADFDTTIAAAQHMIDDADKVFDNSNRPANITAADWPKVRPYWEPQSRHIIATMWVARKDNAKSEQELTKMLQRWPNDALLDQMLGQVILAQNKTNPEKQPLALFYYARAACYDGDGSLPEANRKTLQSGFLIRAYTTYHGSKEGFDEFCAMAKANAAPPAGFKIKSTADLAQEKADAEAKAARDNPAMALWKTIKTGLTGDGADQFFEGSVKDAALPGKDPNDSSKDLKWKGKIVSMAPAIRPKTLVVAVENPAGDVTLKFETALPGKMDVGTEIEFSGTAKAYTKDPFMLTLETEKDQIVGWKPVAPPPAKKSAPKKQAQ
jgi:hypothetical protein